MAARRLGARDLVLKLPSELGHGLVAESRGAARPPVRHAAVVALVIALLAVVGLDEIGDAATVAIDITAVFVAGIALGDAAVVAGRVIPAAGSDLRRTHRGGNDLNSKVSDLQHRSAPRLRSVFPPRKTYLSFFETHHPDVALFQRLPHVQSRTVFRHARRNGLDQFRAGCQRDAVRRHVPAVEIENSNALLLEKR